mgnify:CR=1 FL=1
MRVNKIDVKNCAVCGKEFYRKNRKCFRFYKNLGARIYEYPESITLWRKRTFCSLLCKSISQKGKSSWNKGLKGIQPWHNISGLRPPDLGRKIPNMRDAKHFAWKGNMAGYRSKHIWVETRYGKPDTCEYCGKYGLKGHQIHWANKSREYKRELTDWLRLCAKCHKAYDRDLVTV